MNKERELLQKVLNKNHGLLVGTELYKEIEQELSNPINLHYERGLSDGHGNLIRMYKEIDEQKNKYMDENENLTNYILELEEKIEKLSKPEKQPLTDEEIYKAYKTYRDGNLSTNYIEFKTCVKFAEKHHGITK
jgi:hypothetical protein